MTGRAGFQLGARFIALAITALAIHRRRHGDGGFLAGKGIFQADFEIETQIIAACRAGMAATAASAAAPEGIAEHLFENIGKFSRTAGPERALAAIAAIATLLESGMAHAIIGGALVSI